MRGSQGRNRNRCLFGSKHDLAVAAATNSTTYSDLRDQEDGDCGLSPSRWSQGDLTVICEEAECRKGAMPQSGSQVGWASDGHME